MANPPPLNTPYSLCPTPEILDNLIVEKLNVENSPGIYVRIPPGTPYPDQDLYPGYIFLTQKTVSHDTVQRYWNTPGYVNQDCTNYDIDYVSDSAEHPVFLRRYKTRRDVYDELPRGVAGTLSGVWLITLTNPGSGYDPENPPTVTIAGTGAGAAAVALVNPDTSLSWIRITSEGTGYTAVPTVTIDPPSAGTTAIAVATIQATTCVLVSQKVQEFPEDDPRSSLFVLETRTYQTFPGPYLDRWDYEARIDRYIKIRKRLILSSTVPADPNAVTLPAGTIIEYQDLTDVYTAEITTVVPSTGFVWEDGGADYVYQAFVNHRFPDQITRAPVIQVLGVLATTGLAVDYGWDIIVDEGYAGPCVASIAERYTFDPTDAAFIAGLPTPTLVFPKAETIFAYAWGLISDSPFAQVRTFPVPLSLHAAFDVVVNYPDASFEGYANKSFKPQLTATVPTKFIAGDTMTIVTEPQRVGIGGLWICRIITITHP